MLRVGAAAYVASLAALFLPYSFSNYYRNTGYTNTSSYDFFTAAINSADNYLFAVILTALALLLALIYCFRKNPFLALISGGLALILFVVLFILIPFNLRAGDLVQKMTFKPLAFFAPVACFIGVLLSFLAFLLSRKRNV
jgi:hypothetical protein